MMQESKYNYIMQDNTGMVIYNAKSDEIIALTPQLAELFNRERNEPGTIQKVHQELYNYLVDKSVLVEEGIDESKAYIEEREKQEKDSKEFTITVNPTLACNMKCWYCYENHANMPAMSEDVIKKTLLLVSNLCTSEKIEKLNLSFFGGEPLLYFDKVVNPILKETKEICAENKVKLSIHFTTNAYLLNEKVLEELKGLDVSFQITLDGNKNVHDTVRITKSNGPTYNTIVKHIHQALSAEFSVGVRFNYTNRSLPSFIDVISDFENLPESHKNKLNFSFQRLWQDHEGDAKDIEKKVEAMEEKFEDAGFYVNHSNDYHISYCYADKKNTAVINYNGNLYKCTARDFTSKNREGVLSSDGKLQWNEKNKKRMSIRYGNDYCRKCRIYPICHGGCTQMKLESSIENGCPKGYGEERIEQIMKGRAMYLLKQYKKLNGKR